MPDEKGKLTYVSLRDLLPKDPVILNVINITSKGDYVYFSSLSGTFVYNRKRMVVDTFYKVNKHFPLVVDNKVYALNASGLYSFNGYRDNPIDTSAIFKQHSYAKHIVKLSNNKLLFNSFGNGLFVYDFSDKSLLRNNLNGFVDKMTDRNGFCGVVEKISSNKFAEFSEMPSDKFGVIIFDSLCNTEAILGKESGLSQNFAYHSKQFDDILWTVSFCPTKIECLSPFRYFGEKQNLTGAVNSIVELDNKFFIITTDGIFEKFVTDENVCIIKKCDIRLSMLYRAIKFHNPYNNEEFLIIASQSGIYQFLNNQLKMLSDLPCDMVSVSKSDPKCFYADMGGNILKFQIKPDGNFVKISNQEYNQIHNWVSSYFVEDDNGVTWFNENGEGIRMLNHDKLTKIPYPKGISKEIFIHKVDNRIIFSTDKGLYQYDNKSGLLVKSDIFGDYSLNDTIPTTGIYNYGNGYILLRYTGGAFSEHFVQYIEKDSTGKFVVYDKLFRRIVGESFVDDYCARDSSFWIICNDAKVYSFKFDFKNGIANESKRCSRPFNCQIRRVESKDSILFNGAFADKDGFVCQIQNQELIPEINFSNRNITFSYAATFYECENFTKYSYYLEGCSDEWSPWSDKCEAVFTNLFEGRYVFKVKAKNIYGFESNIAEYTFVILPPFYRTVWAYIFYFIILVLVIRFIIRLYLRKLKADNENLEAMVKKRTTEIFHQNEEIRSQRDEIEAQRDQIQIARDEILKSKEEIISSVQYASYIQHAALTPEDVINQIFKSYFLFYFPRDIVSGDFYWFNRIDNKVYGAIADCTGHGVSGGFMSMLGISLLNEYVKRNFSPSVILDNIRKSLISNLHQNSQSGLSQDGMDMALFVLDTYDFTLQYAGANISLYIVRDKKLIVLNADRIPVGIHRFDSRPFTNQIFTLCEGDIFYLFSDGYVDQFGGDSGRKYMISNFRKKLVEISDLPLNEQKSILEQEHNLWRGHHPQTDDIIVFGAKIESIL